MSFYNFLKSSAGNMAVSFGIMAVPITIGIGIAIDTASLLHAKTDLQAAVDSAALAGGKAMMVSSKSGVTAAQDFLDGNEAYRRLLSVDKTSLVPDEDNGTFGVAIEGKVQMTLMRLVGIETMDIGVSSLVNVGSGELEIALVLDNTASMASEGRMDALKTATTQMLDKLEQAKNAGAKIKVSIVPFADYVNVGVGNRYKSWLDVPADKSTKQEVCNDDYGNATKSNCRIESGTWMNDGVPTPWSGEVCDWTGVVKNCSMQDVKSEWHGCVGSRGMTLQSTIESPNVAYPGLMDRWCPSPVIPLTKSFDDLRDGVGSLITQGQTYLPSGLVWGWNVLSDSEPFTNAMSLDKMKKKGGRKIMMLMTDGNNTVSSDGKHHEIWDGVKANSVTGDLCNNIRTDHIEVYTVGFKVSDADTVNLLSNCASSPAHAYSASDNAELIALFQNLSEVFTQVRLSQ